MRIGPQDKPFITPELKQLKRLRQREYCKNGKSLKYQELRNKFDQKYKLAAQRFLRKKKEELKMTEPGKAYRILKNMGAQPGDSTDGNSFTLPEHLKDNLSPKQSADRIAQYFAQISNEYPPLDLSTLPERVKVNLNSESKPPIISEYDCYKKIIKAKKPKTGVPGELPARIVKEYDVELAKPLQVLFNKIIQSGIWPEQWKTEYTTPIGKIPVPESEDDLRPISLTPFFSKVMEHFVVQWLLEVFGHKLDFRQYGGLRGNSINHYLIELLNFILYNQDSNEPTAILACLIDFSKAFNRQNHNLLITKLSDLGAPSWLLKIVISFLKHRRMIIRYNGASSCPVPLPGGGPQGTLLGLLLFIVLINEVGFEDQHNDVGEIITCKRRLREVNKIHLKYVDDLLIAESINLNQQLITVPPQERDLPDQFHARTGHQLPEVKSEVHCQLLKTVRYAEENQMQLNLKKTKLMLFNPSRTRDFMPCFNIDGNQIEVVNETRLLGVTVRSDLSWAAHVDDIVKRCNRRLWMLRRLKRLGADNWDLKEIYETQIRSILEYAAPVWHPSLTGDLRHKLERVQKSALHIILADNYKSYTSACKSLKFETLHSRREFLCKKFARKSFKNPKFNKWFKLNNIQTKTRFKQPKLLSVISRTNRFKNSPISYMTSLLNKEAK